MDYNFRRGSHTITPDEYRRWSNGDYYNSEKELYECWFKLDRGSQRAGWTFEWLIPPKNTFVQHMPAPGAREPSTSKAKPGTLEARFQDYLIEQEVAESFKDLEAILGSNISEQIRMDFQKVFGKV